jgi:phosphate:Na+ symporter
LVNCCLNSIHEIERIGDHCISSAESLEFKHKNNVDFSEPADKELEALANIVYKIIGHGIKHFETGDNNLYYMIREVEESIDRAQKKARKKHIKRMNEKKCKPSGGIVFVDLINNFERIGDHVQNVAIIAQENSLSSESPDMKPFKK